MWYSYSNLVVFVTIETMSNKKGKKSTLLTQNPECKKNNWRIFAFFSRYEICLSIWVTILCSFQFVKTYIYVQITILFLVSFCFFQYNNQRLPFFYKKIYFNTSLSLSSKRLTFGTIICLIFLTKSYLNWFYLMLQDRYNHGFGFKSLLWGWDLGAFV